MKAEVVKGRTERSYGFVDGELIDDDGDKAPATIVAIGKRIGFEDFDVVLEWEATIESERETNHSEVASHEPTSAMAVSTGGAKVELTDDEAKAIAAEWDDEIVDQAGELLAINGPVDFTDYDD